eukprot:Em0002g402a
MFPVLEEHVTRYWRNTSPGTGENMSPSTGGTCHPVLEEHVTRYWRNMSPGTGGTCHPGTGGTCHPGTGGTCHPVLEEHVTRVLEEHVTRVFTKVVKAFTLPGPARSDLTASCIILGGVELE